MADAYTAGLAMLARGELSTAQVRERLARKGFDDAAIDAAVDKLRSVGALDDARAAQALARRAAHIRGHGRRRAIREIEGRGIGRELARQAVDTVYGELDEPALLERAVARAARGAPTDRAAQRRLYQRLIRQGFDGAAVVAALRQRGAGAQESASDTYDDDSAD